jgi:hypothetical protein
MNVITKSGKFAPYGTHPSAPVAAYPEPLQSSIQARYADAPIELLISRHLRDFNRWEYLQVSRLVCDGDEIRGVVFGHNGGIKAEWLLWSRAEGHLSEPRRLPERDAIPQYPV